MLETESLKLHARNWKFKVPREKRKVKISTRETEQ